jgi:hypothetical protein
MNCSRSQQGRHELWGRRDEDRADRVVIVAAYPVLFVADESGVRLTAQCLTPDQGSVDIADGFDAKHRGASAQLDGFEHRTDVADNLASLLVLAPVAVANTGPSGVSRVETLDT